MFLELKKNLGVGFLLVFLWVLYFLAKNIFDQKYIQPKIDSVKNRFGKKQIWPKIYLAKNIFGQNRFCQKQILSKLYFLWVFSRVAEPCQNINFFTFQRPKTQFFEALAVQSESRHFRELTSFIKTVAAMIGIHPFHF